MSKYIVYINNQVVDKFNNYQSAYEVLENLQRRFKTAIIEIKLEY